MSLILDALRKMEEERRSKRSAAADIRPQILRYRGSAPPERTGRPYLAVVAGLLLVSAGVGAGFLWKGKDDGTAVVVAAAPAQELLPAAPPAAPALPAVPLPPVSQVPPAAQAQAAPPAVTVAPAAAAPSQPAAAAAVQPAPPAAAAEAGARAPRGKRGRKGTTAGAVAPGAASQPQPSASEELGSIPGIAISGIAWQEDRSLRRAVLNGSLVGEGAEVAGARVVEIRENKVRMSRGGQYFDVPFAAGQGR